MTDRPQIPPALRGEIARRIRREDAASETLKFCPKCQKHVPLKLWHRGKQGICAPCKRDRP